MTDQNNTPAADETNTAAAAPAAPAKRELTEKELDALREFHISIDWRGIKKAWMKVFYDVPFDVYHKSSLWVEGKSRKMMTGRGSWLGMPLGIILRNTSRTMYNLSSKDAGWGYLGAALAVAATGVAIVGAVGLLAAPAIAAGIVGLAGLAGISLVTAGTGLTIFGLPIVAAGALVSVSGAGFIAGALSYAAFLALAIPAATMVAIPAFTAATLTTSTAIGAVVATLSTAIAAPLNLVVGWRRAKAAKNGITLTDEQIEALQTEFDRQSPTLRRERQAYNAILNQLHYVSAKDKQELFVSLKAEFDAAAAKAAGQDTAASGPKKTKGGVHIEI